MTPSPGCSGAGGRGATRRSSKFFNETKKEKKGGKKSKKKKPQSEQGSELATENVQRGARPSEFPSRLCEPRRWGPGLGCCSQPGKRPPPKLPIPPKSLLTPGSCPHPSPAQLRTPALECGGADGVGQAPQKSPSPGRGQTPKPQSHQTPPKQRNLHPAEQDEFVTFASPSQAGGPRATSTGIRASYFWDPPGEPVPPPKSGVALAAQRPIKQFALPALSGWK